jgi:hypothetical protein
LVTHKKVLPFSYDESLVGLLQHSTKGVEWATLVSFGMMYESRTAGFHYENEKCLLPVSNLFSLTTHLLKGFLNLAVAHKIMKLMMKSSSKNMLRRVYQLLKGPSLSVSMI